MLKILGIRFTFLVLLLISLQSFAQDYAVQWDAYFAYTTVNDITYGNGRVYAASENSVFSYDIERDSITTFSTIEGLTSASISAIHYSEAAQSLFVGYSNGLIDVLLPDQEVFKVVAINDKTDIPPGEKRINHFTERDGSLYISTGFGISIYDINRLEFNDSYFIGAAGGRLTVRQTALAGDYIYAATQEGGLRRARFRNTNIIDFENWEPVASGNWRGVVSIEDRIYAVDNGNTLRLFDGQNFSTLSSLPENVLSIEASSTGFVIAMPTAVNSYNQNAEPVANIPNTEQFPGNYTTALLGEDFIFIGSQESGLLLSSYTGSENLLQVLPDGPLRNDPFSLATSPGRLWVVYGDYSNTFNPYPLKNRGLSLLDTQSGWLNYSYEEALSANNMVNITINPQEPEQVFMSSFNAGLLELNSGEATHLFDENNSALSAIPGTSDVRINGAAFDPQGNLWMTNSLVENALARKSGDEITGFSIEEVIPDFNRVNSYTQLVTDAQGNVYFGSSNRGLLAYNPSTETFRRLSGEEESNLPSDDIRSLAIDNSGTLWIGTTAGLRLLYGPAQIFDNPEISTSPIVILENDIPVELLNEQSIQSITVDGSNNKWIGTLSNGVFYFSPSGQETLLQFNTTNSPLPSNTINDIGIDDQSGVVYFATPQGLVSYQGSAVAAASDLQAVRAFPNPVRPEYRGAVIIDGLTANANVKITDITGNLVYEEVSRGGSIQWDTTAFGNHRVASGVYMILVTSSDASETKIAKLMIIR